MGQSLEKGHQDVQGSGEQHREADRDESVHLREKMTEVILFCLSLTSL